MSHTTDQKPDTPATTLATAEDAEQMDLPRVWKMQRH